MTSSVDSTQLRQLADRLHELNVLLDELIAQQNAAEDAALDRDLYQAGVRSLRAVRNQLR